LRVIFRTDAGIQIGTGHLMRCLALAAGLRAEGAECLFLCRAGLGALEQMITDAGHRLMLITGAKEVQRSPEDERLAHDHWLPGGWKQDLDACLDKLASEPVADWLVVDHYALDRRWEGGMRAAACSIMVIDDLADRMHNCDLLVDQNYFADMMTRYFGKVPSHCRSLLGPQYALLRDEFGQLRPTVEVRCPPVRRVLVFFGGVDAGNYTGRTIAAFDEMVGFEVDVVIGSQHPYRDEIVTECTRRGYVFHVQTHRMAELMARADLAIGAGGSASWERCCLGLPSIVGSVANNQDQTAHDLADLGVTSYIGGPQEITVERLQCRIRQVCASNWLSQASARGMELVDGQGVARVVGILRKS